MYHSQRCFEPKDDNGEPFNAAGQYTKEAPGYIPSLEERKRDAVKEMDYCKFFQERGEKK